MLKNHTLSSLGHEDLEDISPYVVEVATERGQILIRQGFPVEYLYFPVTAYLANTIVFEDGRATLTHVTGSEGVFGLGPFLADEAAAWNVEVRTSGSAYRLPAIVLRRRMNVSPTLQAHLLRMAYAYQARVAFGAGCASRHLATARLATLILNSADRSNSDDVHLTQQDIADFLGMQRTTANTSAKALKDVGAVRYSRGSIRVLDRGILSEAACPCYAAARSVFPSPANDADAGLSAPCVPS